MFGLGLPKGARAQADSPASTDAFPIVTLESHLAPEPRIGLVLGGGGARGFAHIGTLKMLDSLGIEVDCIAGTSIGSILGGLYATGHTGLEIERIALETEWSELFADRPPRKMLPYRRRRESGRYTLEFGLRDRRVAPASGLIFGQNVTLLLAELTYPWATIHDFDQLPIPFRCVAINLVNGDEVVLDSGSLSRSMRASMAIPSVFSPVSWGDSLLIDGGMKNNLPVDVARQMGADIVIAADVSKVKGREQLRSVLDVMGQSIALADAERREYNQRDADILITPDITDFTMSDFQTERVHLILEEGEKAARAALPQLIALSERANPLVAAERAPRPGRDNCANTHVRRITVSGNRNHSAEFIRDRLGLRAGDALYPRDLNFRIRRLYALGYFQEIWYEIDAVTDEEVDLRLMVEELPAQNLRCGLRFDNMHKLVASVGVQAVNRLFSGLLLEGEVQFIGLTRVMARASHPSRSLDFPLYPFVQGDFKNTLTDLYDTKGEVITTYKDRSTILAAGVGFTPVRWCNLEVAWRQEYMNTEAKLDQDETLSGLKSTEELHQIRAEFDLDTLDDVFLPRRGVHLRGTYERSFDEFGSPVRYELYSTSLDSYWAIHRRHTVRLYGFWGNGSQVPPYKCFDQSRPATFVGTHYHQLYGDDLTVLRFDYRYRHSDLVRFSLIANAAPRFRFSPGGESYDARAVFGAGLAATFVTPLGPFELIGSQGRLEFPGRVVWQTRFDVVFGARF